MADMEQIFYFPFDSLSIENPDRAVKSIVFSDYLKAFFSDGVFPVLPQFPEYHQLAVSTNGGLGVNVNTGLALIDGKIYGQKIVREFNFDAADSALGRIDRIVVRKNENQEYRNNEIYVLKGNAATIPVPPELTRNNVVKEISLAKVYIPAGATVITAENITDERADTFVCGYVTNVIGQVDTSVINAKFEEFYNRIEEETENWQQEEKEKILTWFEDIKEQLSGDVAANLLNMINEIKADIGNLEDLNTDAKTSIVDAINELKDGLDNAQVDTVITMEEAAACTEPEKPVGVGAFNELSQSLANGQVKFQVTDGELYYSVYTE